LHGKCAEEGQIAGRLGQQDASISISLSGGAADKQTLTFTWREKEERKISQKMGRYVKYLYRN